MLTLKVSGMTCAHCVAAVTKAVQNVQAVDGVSVDLASGTIAITGQPDPRAVRDAIVGEGYEVAA